MKTGSSRLVYLVATIVAIGLASIALRGSTTAAILLSALIVAWALDEAADRLAAALQSSARPGVAAGSAPPPSDRGAAQAARQTTGTPAAMLAGREVSAPAAPTGTGEPDAWALADDVQFFADLVDLNDGGTERDTLHQAAVLLRTLRCRVAAFERERFTINAVLCAHYALRDDPATTYRGLAGRVEQLAHRAVRAESTLDAARGRVEAVQQAVEGWIVPELVDQQVEAMEAAGLAEHPNGDIRCGVANLRNANRILRAVRALTTDGQTAAHA